MEFRTSASLQRSPLGTLLVLVFALAGCTRDERAAPPSEGERSALASSQPSSKTATQLSPAALGFDSVTARKDSGSTCYVGARYVVVAHAQEIGQDLYVRPRGAPDAAPQCEADSLGGDMVFRTGAAASHHPDVQWFLGLKGDLLAAWDGTGGASDLYIYDLNKRVKALEVEDADVDNLQWLSPTTVAMWVTKASEKQAAAAGCPDTVPSNPAQLDSLMILDLETLILRPTGRSRCILGQ